MANVIVMFIGVFLFAVLPWLVIVLTERWAEGRE